MFYYYDPTYVLVLIGFVLSLFASFGVKSTFAKYSKINASRGITATVRRTLGSDINASCGQLRASKRKVGEHIENRS